MARYAARRDLREAVASCFGDSVIETLAVDASIAGVARYEDADIAALVERAARLIDRMVEAEADAVAKAAPDVAGVVRMIAEGEMFRAAAANAGLPRRVR